MSTVKVDYFLRLSGRFGSSIVGALGAGVSAGASLNAGGALPKSSATGAGGGVQACCGTSGEGVIHCGCSGTLDSGAVPNPAIFPRHRFPVQLLFLYHVSKLRYLR